MRPGCAAAAAGIVLLFPGSGSGTVQTDRSVRRIRPFGGTPPRLVCKKFCFCYCSISFLFDKHCSITE